ncbi:MAG: nuclear transport factor 2 family protein [Halioglobus sp.]
MNALEIWHEIMREGSTERLHEIIADDCVFYSPVVHTPQKGKKLTMLYLTGAANVFNDSFVYTKEIASGNHAMLEFSCEVDGIMVNGVDIMSFDGEGKIIEFKVMVRPLKGVNMLHGKMRAMLEELSAQAS